MIDRVGMAGGWGTCQDCTGNIRQIEITDGLWIWKVLHHDETCPQLREVCS